MEMGKVDITLSILHSFGLGWKGRVQVRLPNKRYGRAAFCHINLTCQLKLLHHSALHSNMGSPILIKMGQVQFVLYPVGECCNLEVPLR